MPCLRNANPYSVGTASAKIVRVASGTLFCIWLLLSVGFAHAQQQTVAGRIDEAQGDVRIYDSAQQPRPAKAGDTVREGDSVVTGADGEVHIAMEDEGQLAVRPNTRLRIAKYKAEGGSGDSSVIALVEGALRSVTGWIGKYNPRGYAIRTPTATIGVRGTDHETVVIASGSGGEEAGTYDKVNQGATVLSTKHGQTEVRPNQAGFVSHSGTSKPRLLASVPNFYRPARLDRRFENLHEKVRERIDSKRTQRVEAVRERRLKSEETKRRGGSESRAAKGERWRDDANRKLQQQRHEQMEKRREGQSRRSGELRQQESGRTGERHPRVEQKNDAQRSGRSSVQRGEGRGPQHGGRSH